MVSFGAIDDRAGCSDPADPPGRYESHMAHTDCVIGMACRLPGGIESPPEQLWDALLRGGDDLVTEVPRDRWDNDEYYDPPESGVPGRTASKWAPSSTTSPASIPSSSASPTTKPPRSIRSIGCCSKLHGRRRSMPGSPPGGLKNSLTGVFTGLTHADYQTVSADSDAMEGPYGFSGNTFSMAAGRIAYTLGLRGPALAVDTACSSGLLAVHMAAAASTRVKATSRWPAAPT